MNILSSNDWKKEEIQKLFDFTDNLDLLALDMAEKHSNIWFNKNLEKRVLQNYLNNICDTDDEENLYLDIVLDKFFARDKVLKLLIWTGIS